MIPKKNIRLIPEIALLCLMLVMLFIMPVYPLYFGPVFDDLIYTLIFLACSMSLISRRSLFLKISAALGVLLILATAADFDLLYSILKVCCAIFFIVIVIALIKQIATSRKVNAAIILSSINGYLLLGLIFSLMVGLLKVFHPAAYNIPVDSDHHSKYHIYFSEFSYYAFMTMTTVGYGDYLPLSRDARALAMLIAICGQLYLTILVAMLVGKFISSQSGK